MAPRNEGLGSNTGPTPGMAALGYLLLGCLWILVSDTLLSYIFGEDAVVGTWAMFKGIAFIALTSTVMYGLLARQRRSAAELLTRTPARSLTPPGAKFNPDEFLNPQTDWLAELVEATPQCIGISALDGRVVYLNPAGCRLLELGQEDLAEGLHVSCFYTPEAWRDLQERTWPTVRREGLWTGETELINASGEAIPVYQVLIAHRDAQGMVTHFSSHAHDLREAAARKRDLRLISDILGNSTEGVTVVDRRGNIDWVNPSFTRILGYSADELQGCSPGEFGEAGFDHETFRRLCKDAEERGEWQGEVAIRRRNGEVFPVRMSITPFHDPSGRLTNFSILISDLTRYRHFESQLSFLANHDPLTGLSNSVRFQEDLGQALEKLGDDYQVCLLLLDLYDFQMINESFGRATGDEVLVEVAHRLSMLESESCRVARLSGDEFGIMMVGAADEISPAVEAQRVQEIFHRPFAIGDSKLFLAGSIGVVLAPEDGLDVQTLVRNAEIGVKRARAQGENSYEFYSDQLQARSRDDILIASGLRSAISEGDFQLVYQPIVDLSNGQACGVEALVRWTHPELGVISPDRFIPVAERTGLIEALGDFVMRRACIDFAELLNKRPDFQLAINVSPAQIKPGVFSTQSRDVVREAGVSPDQITLEITESLMMQDPEMTERAFRELATMGFTISIDDFGTGFSSLAMLKQFPVHSLKVDQCFTRGLPSDAGNVMMTRTIIAMARGFGLITVAEGIETREQLDFLAEEECEIGQGYYFSRPLPLDDIRQFLKN